MIRACLMTLIACGLIGLTGCGAKLNFSEEAKLTNNHWVRTIDPFKKDTEITVEVTSDEFVHVFVLPEKTHTDDAEMLFSSGKAPPNVAHKLNTKSATVTATAPAGEPMTMYIVKAKGKEANIKVTAKN